MNWELAATVVSVVWAVVQMVPKVRQWRQETRNAVILSAIEAGVVAAYNAVTRPARVENGVAKLPDEVRKEAILYAMETAIDTAETHGVDLQKAMTGDELRAALTKHLTTLKGDGVIGTSRTANNTTAKD